MINRLTVSQIFGIEDPTQVTQNLSILTLFSTQKFIYLIDEADSKSLKRISLKDFHIVDSISLPKTVYQKSIKSLTQIKGVIVFALQGSNDLFCIDHKKQCMRLMSHMGQINRVICYKNMISTCSDDFTVRIWNQSHGSIVQNQNKHIYSGHSGKVTCSQTYQSVLVSGSKDKSVIFWRNDAILCTYRATSQIKNLSKCPQSNQFLIFAQNGQISVINMRGVMKNSCVQVLRIIKYTPQENSQLKNCFNFCSQIDDSFALFTDLNSVVFVQMNLGEIISKKQLSEASYQNIIGVKSVGRMLLYGKHTSNLQMFRF